MRLTSLLIMLTLLATTVSAAPSAVSDNEKKSSASMTAKWFETSNAQWVWPAKGHDGPNQYVQFIHDFELPADALSKELSVAISADTNYAVWLNGTFAGFGQWSNFPDDKTYDILDLTSLATKSHNRLSVLVFYQGHSTSTYRKGKPGVVFAVGNNSNLITASGSDTRFRQAPDYLSGPIALVTGQLGYTFEHYANKEDGWLDAQYVSGTDWRKALPPDLAALSTRPVRPRPVAKLNLEPPLPMAIVAQGVFSRDKEKPNPAEAMQSDALTFKHAGDIFTNPRPTLRDNDTTGITLKPESWKSHTGPYMVLDTGYEEAGLLALDIEATSGTIIDIGYGEHLDDLRVRTHVGGRHFANRYVCKDGHQTFLHPFLRLAGRYIQLNITPAPGATGTPLIIKYAGIQPTPYPAPRIGSFESSDLLHNEIYDVSRRTLELCMHEHYEDCPWREQALYSMDGRNQALAGYYCFGNYDFARASIGLLGQGMNDTDGLLELCAPADISITIPSFSLAWILMLDDYLMFSGDRDFVQSQLPIARQLLHTFEKRTSGSLIKTPIGKRMWNFYEWAPGLDGSDRSNPDNIADAPLNLFYLLALDACDRMTSETQGDGAEFSRRATALRSAFHKEFWSNDHHAYLTRIGAGTAPHYAELTQALAIIANVVPESYLPALREKLASVGNTLEPCTISHTLYKFQALLSDSDKYGRRVVELITRDWGYMLHHGATSFWETIEGADAFNKAGSLCHGWSGVPAWFYGAYVLGVKPTQPGFTRYECQPVPGPFNHAQGTIPTPDGPLAVTWKVSAADIKPQIEVKKVAP